jgi:hypothetical protein
VGVASLALEVPSIGVVRGAIVARNLDKPHGNAASWALRTSRIYPLRGSGSGHAETPPP